jgi:hypothetical protein
MEPCKSKPRGKYLPAKVPGTILGQAAWTRLCLAVSSARNTRLEYAPSIGSSNKRPQLPQAEAVSFSRRAELI